MGNIHKTVKTQTVESEMYQTRPVNPPEPFIVADFNKMEDELWQCRDKILESCLNYFYEALSRLTDNIITFADIKTNKKANGISPEPYEKHTVYITYDGGNRPKENGKAFSRVNAVFLKNEEIFLNLDDCAEYNIHRVHDIYEVLLVLKVTRYYWQFAYIA